MIKNNQKNDKFFLETMADSLAIEMCLDVSQTTEILQQSAYRATEDDIELRDIPQVVEYLCKAGCFPGDIIRSKKLGYCKKIIEEYSKIIKQKHPEMDETDIFAAYSQYMKKFEELQCAARRSRK